MNRLLPARNVDEMMTRLAHMAVKALPVYSWSTGASRLARRRALLASPPRHDNHDVFMATHLKG